MTRYDTESDLRQADFSDRPVSELSDQERQELNRRFKEFVKAMKGQLPGDDGADQAKPKKTVKKWNPVSSQKGSKWIS